MKHYIAYHNETKMGGPLGDDNPFVALSSRPLDEVTGHVVWCVRAAHTPAHCAPKV
jgi:hypothetical protein